MIRFANDTALYLLFSLPLLMVFFYFVQRWRRAALARFGNLLLLEQLMPALSHKRRVWKQVLLLLALGFMILALARPQVGTALEEVKREGVDVMIAIDVSESMYAEDVPPNRLAKARHEVVSLIDKLQGDRVGLIAFAGEAFVQCPLTLDYGAAKIFLEVLEPGLIPTPGTALGKAIALALQSFENTERQYKVLILITDGESHDEDTMAMAAEAERQGVVIYTVGIGSTRGVPIPVVDAQGNRTGEFKRNRSGEVVVTKLDELTLEKIALQTGGKYHRASSGEAELDRIYEEIAQMEKKELASLKFSHYEERFQYVLPFALVLLLVELLLSERRKVRTEWRGRLVAPLTAEEDDGRPGRTVPAA
ncbi:MAG: VWA domain-containing protein [candidate division KSB1 bacterium]|nr:VWA domain-containing protein [candidate division KSB1 bacterium]MDZ7274510.1 VWA domain-containing protein [candidate division KSB1 bacterium]MDZ7284829.1 VWA domain-containing protein [candidate division KSB1 bacterium]MDZ7297751.1 VWA domain-containing protein [candidate division KSB1 bacterium]MDZ7308682.1 VWA domain-containing protein [candidate division KSB1 bacterium]